jgi:hypothetical protein
MDGIEASVILIGKVANDTAGNGDAHSENIDDDEGFILHHAAIGYEQVVFNHRAAMSICMPVA